MKCPNCGDSVDVHSERDCILGAISVRDAELVALYDHEIARNKAEIARVQLQRDQARAELTGLRQLAAAQSEELTKIHHEERPVRTELRLAQARLALIEHERDAYRAMVCDLVASAHPHPTEHPTMTKQWERARALLKDGPSDAALAKQKGNGDGE